LGKRLAWQADIGLGLLLIGFLAGTLIESQVVLSCGDLPDPWISNDHKHAVISLR
jgi:hypothetical protein